MDMTDELIRHISTRNYNGVKRLLDQGANPNVLGSDYRYPLTLQFIMAWLPWQNY